MGYFLGKIDLGHCVNMNGAPRIRAPSRRSGARSCQAPRSRLWGAPATRQLSLIDGPPSSTARVQHVSTTQMLMGLAASAELQRRSACS